MKIDLDSAVEKISEHKWVDIDRIFLLSMFIFVTYVLIRSFGYSSRGQLLPLIVSIPTLGLLIIVLAYKISPTFAEHINSLFKTNGLDIEERMGDLGDRGDVTTSEEPGETKQLVQVLAWILITFILILLTGFLPALLIFLSAFYRIQAKQPWTLTILYTLLAWGFIYVIFQIVLNVPLYQGILR